MRIKMINVCIYHLFAIHKNSYYPVLYSSSEHLNTIIEYYWLLQKHRRFCENRSTTTTKLGTLIRYKNGSTTNEKMKIQKI
jgi:hypothetical protein